MGPMIAIIVAIFAIPVVGLVWWSVSKSGRLKKAQLENWTPVAERLGGTLIQQDGRYNHHVLKAPISGVPVMAEISHHVVADAAVAKQLRTNNEFRTQVHATVAKPGPTYFLRGVKPGKGKLNFGSEELRGLFVADQDTGLAGVANPEAQALLLKLHAEFRNGAMLVSGGNMVSLLFNSNTTDPAVIEDAVKLVGTVAAAA